MSIIKNYLNDPGWDQGIYELDSYDEYDSIQALRSSDLKKISRSPAHYKAAIEHQAPVSNQLKKSFAKGKAFDTLIMHGMDAFNDIVVIEPDLNKNSNAYKDWVKEQKPDAVILNHLEHSYILMMYKAAMAKTQFSKIFAGDGAPHKVIVWQDYSSKLWCKAEIDWIIKDSGTVVDLKTSADAGFWFFQRQARRLGYANQGAFYLSGLSTVTRQLHRDFLLAVVESDPPFESHVFRPSDEQLDNAQVENERRMEILAECFEKDEWPGYTDEIIDMDSGQYLYYDYEDMDDLTEDYTHGF